MQISEKSKIKMPYNERTQNKADKGDGKQKYFRETVSTHYFKRNTNRYKDKRDWQQENERIEGGADTHTNEDRGLEREKCTLAFPFLKCITITRTWCPHIFSSISHAVTGSSDEKKCTGKIEERGSNERRMNTATGNHYFRGHTKVKGQAWLVRGQHWLKKVCLSGMQRYNFFSFFLHIHAAVITPSI